MDDDALEDALGASDFRREAYDPPEGERDEGIWQIHFPLAPAEKAPFQRAAPGVVPAERMEFHTDITDEADGDTTFAIHVQASTRGEAIEKARHAVSKIRGEAGLRAAVVKRVSVVDAAVLERIPARIEAQASSPFDPLHSNDGQGACDPAWWPGNDPGPVRTRGANHRP